VEEWLSVADLENRSGADLKQESSEVGAYPDRRDNDTI